MRRLLVLAALSFAAVAGCARHDAPAGAALTERQRDSILAREPVPGAATVGRALDASDRAAGRAAAIDSLAH